MSKTAFNIEFFWGGNTLFSKNSQVHLFKSQSEKPYLKSEIRLIVHCFCSLNRVLVFQTNLYITTGLISSINLSIDNLEHVKAYATKTPSIRIFALENWKPENSKKKFLW